jgi:phosphohistidine swiveling domain-containing protein
LEGLEIVAASTGKEALQELRPAESGCSAFAAARLDIGVVVGALMASFVLPALKRCTVPADRGRWPHPDSPLWLDVRAEHV